MELRVLRTAEGVGLSREDLARLRQAHALAMDERRRRLGGDRHPAFLHPGRTALVLMEDLAESSAAVLEVAVLVESEHPELEVASERIEDILGLEATELRDSVPIHRRCGERLLEELLAATEPVRRIALAERLDQLRHAHLWPDPERRRQAHSQAEAVYLPLSGRVHPVLERRYRWWCGMFGRRHT